MKNLKFLLVLLVVILSLCLVFVACNGDDTTVPTSTDPSGSSAAPASSGSSNTSATPDNTTNPDPDETTEPVIDFPGIEPTNEAEVYLYGENNDALRDYMPQHMPIEVIDYTDKDGIKRQNTVYFTIKAEGGNFLTDENGTSGLAFTSFDRLYIVDHGTATSPLDNPVCTQYTSDCYETKNWWEIWVTPHGWNPEPGHRYEFYLFITGEESTVQNYTSLYFWNMGEENWWTAPSPIVSNYGNIEEMVPNFHDRSELPYHDKFIFGDTDAATGEATAQNVLHFTFGSKNQFKDTGVDGGPNPTDEELEGLSDAEKEQYWKRGLSQTAVESVYINGKKVSFSNYRTYQWYQIYLEIDPNFQFESGKTYEFVISISALDQSGVYCTNSAGYFIFYEYTAP